MSIFTIGYGGRRFTDFVALLQRHDIAFVADIRRFPKSTVPEYNRESLEAKLPEFGISYVSMGDTLGGFRQGGYRKYMESDLYKTGIIRLLELAERGNVVLMCKERRDAGCHRRHIVDTLANRGIKTIPLA
ncbi:MAG: DUF488 domain-containing protein [Dehalococcoidia bacterium]|nr:MAG: DUF488 domain-containing protein [Dehalococcoidia bacterium]